MAHAVLERKEILHCVETEGIILGNLVISKREVDLACVNKVDSQTGDNGNNYAKSHEELIPIKKVKRMVAFRNHGIH